MVTIGEKIRFYRKKKSLSQKKLGELARISETSIKKYESGDRNPKLEQIYKLATVLGVKVEDLVDLPEEYLAVDSIEACMRKAEEVGRILGSDMEYTITKDETDGALGINIHFQLTKETTEEMIATVFKDANDYDSFEKALISLLSFELHDKPIEERERIYTNLMKAIADKFES